uniref:Uncharacterized protein n=1 Tax=Pristionchus pacificus TaxID=54126 RepID=A0A2A6CZA9_PRIPA|eukprot:PDM83564.1 hypothetical protein PRIPAC_30051 [Pristionchus pacificus]
MDIQRISETHFERGEKRDLFEAVREKEMRGGIEEERRGKGLQTMQNRTKEENIDLVECLERRSVFNEN